MLKKFFPFFILQVLANILWAFWVLPAIGEEGTLLETEWWIGMQTLLPVLLSVLLARGRRYALWLVVAYAAMILLFGLGVFGWALMGAGTPVSIYVVCAMFFIIGFGVLFRALKDLNIGQKPRQFGLDE